ncbi:MAG TPA: 2OG-Fe(II) oxygenase [Allosphingosinicella sp.]|nr:2OG-Fe(II) oxygenase [Allosphingosinicella sp.]
MSTSPAPQAPAADLALRQYASLEQSAAWLLGVIQVDASNAPLEGGDMPARLRHTVTGLNAPAERQQRLLAFCDRFDRLKAERDRLEEMDQEDVRSAAFRFEQAASEALALYVESQAWNAARAAELSSSLPDENDEEARRRHLAEIGAGVRARLDTNPAAEKLPAKGLELYIVRNFLTPEECDGLVALIERDLYPSGLLKDHPDREYRTSKSCNLGREEPLVEMVDGRISNLIGVDRRFSETVQGQRYEVGQQFKPHHDFFHKGENYYDSVQRQGGQRSWTGMLFLNEPDAGGCTNFPEARVRVTPERGALLLWNNMAEDGTPNYNSLHQGMPVESGVKYVITKWFRERPWG